MKNKKMKKQRKSVSEAKQTRRVYVVTAIAYANAAPHIGHALEAVQADTVARFYKQLLGPENVRLQTGMDESGQKQYETAKKKNMTPRALADQSAASFRKLWSKLDIGYDRFIRTTDSDHIASSQKIWQACQAAGDIYKKKYEGLYCVGCESFKTEKDLVNGKCLDHKTVPERLTEENYFFQLSKYSEKIREIIESRQVNIVPETRRKEFLSLLTKEGLADVSISRQKNRLPWGVPVAGDLEQVMYVWFDALTNYMTGVGYGDDSPAAKALYKKWWQDPATEIIHVIGKDIIRHHAGIWLGMLLSAQLRLPSTILVHGFVTSQGQKMSKTVGNVVDPAAMVEKYGAQPMRYYLLREIPSSEDGDFSEAQFEKRYTADLAHDLGNLFSRLTNMIEKYGQVETKVKPVKPDFAALEPMVAAFQLHRALESIWKKVEAANKYIDQEKPWEKFKTEPDSVQRVLSELHAQLLETALLLQPFLPEVGKTIATHLRQKKISKATPLFPPLTPKK